MVKNNFMFFGFLLTAFILVWSSPSNAEVEYNVGYNGGTMIVHTTNESIELFHRGMYRIVPIRDVNSPAGKLTLRFFSIGNVTGCADIGGMTVMSEVKKQSLDVKGKDSELSLDQKPRYGNYDCDINLNHSFFDLPIELFDIYKNGISKISIRSQRYGKLSDINITTGKSKIIFNSYLPERSGMAHVSTKVTYWLYPNNTYILSAPSAKAGQNVISEIKELAQQKGLLPLEEMIPDFKLAENATNYYFFYDPNTTMNNTYIPLEQGMVFGNIKTTKTVYTANGPIAEPKNIEVIINSPGEYQ